MDVTLDPEEVLRHLNSLGHRQITKYQLKEFIRDLKKLIKYDLKKERETNQPRPKIYKEIQCQTDNLPFGTISTEKNENLNPQTLVEDGTCTHQCKTHLSKPNIKPLQTENQSKAIISCNCKLASSMKKESERPCSSVIKSSSQPKPIRCDPVTLYHYYQQMWSQQTLPGENPRKELRWKIRHKMMGPQAPTKYRSESKQRKPPPPWVK